MNQFENLDHEELTRDPLLEKKISPDHLTFGPAIDADVFANDGSILPREERDVTGKVIKPFKIVPGENG